MDVDYKIGDSVLGTTVKGKERFDWDKFNKIEQDCHLKQQVPDGKWTRKPLAYRESNNFLIYV